MSLSPTVRCKNAVLLGCALFLGCLHQVPTPTPAVDARQETEQPETTRMTECQMAPEGHHYLGIEMNRQTWKLLGQENRDTHDDLRLERFAQASLYHWQISPEFQPINAQRGHGLLSRVYAVLARGEEALFHASECMRLTDELALQDFDLAFAHEALVRAHAALENTEEAELHHQKAREAGDAIVSKEDRQLFASDLASPPWFGMEF